MPRTTLYMYQDERERVSLLDWFLELKKKDRRALVKCLAMPKLLAKFGNELDRPYAATLRDGIRELRANVGRANYRILYFFHGKDIAILSHGLTKEKEVPDIDIERAIEPKKLYEQNPEKHRAKLPVPENPDDF